MGKILSKGLLLVVAGIIIGVVCTKADELGLGAPGYSWKQGLGTFIGAIAIVYGIYLLELSGKLLVGTGLVIAAFALLADMIGFGTPGYSCSQSIVLVMGIAILLMGVNSLRAKT